MSAAEFMAELARAARSVIAGPGLNDSNRVRRRSEGGHVPDAIAEELARPCACGPAPRVSIRSHRDGTYWLGCLDCVGPALAARGDVRGWVMG